MVIKEKEDSSDQIEWNVETEVQLFYAMTGHKPVGVNKHFQMACILEKFRNALNRDISSKVIWDHLDTMYDMQALDDTENLPFPNDDKDFSLPESEFGALIEQRMKIDSNQEAAENESKTEIKPMKEGNKKDSIKKEARDSIVKKEVKEVKDSVKEIKGEVKDLPKEPKKVHKDRESRRESKDSKEGKKDSRKESREEVKSESSEGREPKVVKQKSSIKEKREVKKEDSEKDDTAVTPNVRKERARESSDDSIKRSGNSSSKRSTRGSIKPDEMNSSKSSSPITTPTPPPVKRRRT